MKKLLDISAIIKLKAKGLDILEKKYGKDFKNKFKSSLEMITLAS